MRTVRRYEGGRPVFDNLNKVYDSLGLFAEGRVEDFVTHAANRLEADLTKIMRPGIFVLFRAGMIGVNTHAAGVQAENRRVDEGMPHGDNVIFALGLQQSQMIVAFDFVFEGGLVNAQQD